MYSYITNKASRQPFPKGWIGYFSGIITYDRPLTDDEINANMFIQTATPEDSPSAARLYEGLSKIQSITLAEIIGGILDEQR